MASIPQRMLNAVWSAAFQNTGVLRHNQIVEKNGMTKAVGFNGKSSAGVFVDHDTALQFSAVWACVNVIAQDIGVLGWHTFERENLAKKRIQLPVSNLLRSAPNPEMGIQTFKEILVAHAMLMGNGYAEIERDAAGNAVGLWPLLPDRTKPVRMQDGRLTYASWVSALNEWVEIPARDMFHLKGLGFNGLVGYDVVSYMTQTIGTGIAAQKYSAAFFGNGTHLSGGLFSKTTLSDDARDHLRKEFEQVYRGSSNAFKMAVFEEDLEWKPFSVSPEAAQVIQTRKHEVREVARWFRVKPHKIGDLDDATYANIENESIDHVGDTILPWAVRFEQEADRKLFTRAQQNAGMFTKLNIDSLMRGDFEGRMKGYKIGREIGVMSINDVRSKEDMNKIEGPAGDVYMVPMNFQNADSMLITSTPAAGADNKLVAAIRPLANEAIERIQTRELHRMKELVGLDLDDSEFGRRVSSVMSKQSTYATSALVPIVSSALYAIYPNDASVPVLVDKVVTPIVNAYTVRHGEAWRNTPRSKIAASGVDKMKVKEMVDELFDAITTEGAKHGK
jgi:HK97 family phage portal protein